MMMKPYENRISDVENSLKTKMLIDFDHSVGCSIKSLAIQKKYWSKGYFEIYEQKNVIVLESLSLASFIYNMIDTFAFPTEKMKNLYSKCRILKCYPYRNKQIWTVQHFCSYSFVKWVWWIGVTNQQAEMINLT